MELRNLRADITSLEAASGLTVDDILGIMQDLWGDVRHESGHAAEDSPVRDADELTSKLIWACNQLVKITERHADALSGVSRLSRLQEKLTALQTQADAYEAAGSKMEQLQAEETRLDCGPGRTSWSARSGKRRRRRRTWSRRLPKRIRSYGGWRSRSAGGLPTARRSTGKRRPWKRAATPWPTRRRNTAGWSRSRRTWMPEMPG